MPNYAMMERVSKKFAEVFCFCAVIAGCATERPAPPSEAAPSMRLADNSVPLADIVIGDDPSWNVLFAAAELKEHLDRIAGASFAVVPVQSDGRKAIKIARTAGLGRQESRIAFSADGISLESGAFPEYAVWDFLHGYCFVSWLDPTDAGTIVPHDPNLSVLCKDRVSRPFFKGRSPVGGYEPELWGSNSPGWTNYLHAAYPSAFADRGFDEALDEISRRKRLFLRRMKAGGDFVSANHSFYWWYDRFWEKRNAGFERFRPGLFARGYEGSRVPPQLCFSNPETLQQTVADIRSYFDNGGRWGFHRGIDSVRFRWGEDTCCVEPMDNKKFCKCEECSRQYRPELASARAQHSDYWFGFVNRVAREISKSHPGKKISTLAYGTHCGVPSFRLEPNVIVHFCFMHNRIPYSERHGGEMRQLCDWRAAYQTRPFGLWMYNIFPNDWARRFTHVNGFPGFFARTLQREYLLLERLDIAENVFNCGFVDDYESFLSLRWMWNPREPLEALEDEYFSSYGAAAAPLKEFYRIVEERYCDKKNYPCALVPRNAFQTPEISWGVLGTGDVMRRLESLMAEAERLADNPLAKARVKNWKYGIWNYMREGYATYYGKSVRKAFLNSLW